MTLYPAVAAGQRVTAALLTAMETFYVVKPAPQSVISSTAFTPDTDLIVPVVANGVYEVTFILFITSDATGDVKTQWTGPAGATCLRVDLGPTDTAANFVNAKNTSARFRSATLSDAATYQTESTANAITAIEQGIFTNGATAGNLGLSFGQGTSAAFNTTILASSYVKAVQIS
jgi:hypothetical protein